MLAMAFSEYLIVRHFAVRALAERGVAGIPLLLPLDAIVELVVEGIKADAVTLLFWAIAVYAAFTIPARRRLARVAGQTASTVS
mgnify:CR=1 FL=1